MRGISRNWCLPDTRGLVCLLVASWKAPSSHKPRMVVDLPVGLKSRYAVT